MEDLKLNPATSALVLIDLQRGTIARQLSPHTSAEVLQNSALLVKEFRERNALIIFVRVNVAEILSLPVDAAFPRPTTALTPQASELVPESGIQPGDIVVTKRQWGAFYGTDLEQHLRRRNLRTVVLGGIATNFGVESTARAAFDRGYELAFAEDAMSSISEEAHTFSVTNMFPRMGRVRTAAEIAQSLGPHQS